MQNFSSYKYLTFFSSFFVGRIFASNPVSIQVVQSIPQVLSYESISIVSAAASSTENSSLGVDNVFDGDMQTRWSSSFSDPQYVILDLGQSYDISKVKIYWEAANAESYTLQGSNNIITWEVLSSRSSGSFGDRTDELDVSGNYRYLKINGTSRAPAGNGDLYGYSIYEVEIFKESPINNDSDSDGVDDAFDECPATLSDIAVNANGCDISVIPGYTSPTFYEGYTFVPELSDDFSGTALNSNKWTAEIGTGCQYSVNLCGWGNNEAQYYLPQNATVSDGRLTITAKKNDAGRSYTSARIKSQGKMSVQYGRIDIRAKMPYGQGIWPALWLLGESSQSWPAKGEIDIMEMIGGNQTGRDDTTHGTIHWDPGNGLYAYSGDSKTLSSGILADEYHVYSIVWTPSQIAWYLDDDTIPYHVENISSYGMSEFEAPFYFILNIAVGGNWPGYPDASTVFPQEMLVDYIRVFQQQ